MNIYKHKSHDIYDDSRAYNATTTTTATITTTSCLTQFLRLKLQLGHNEKGGID